jgi:dCMP deaminase
MSKSVKTRETYFDAKSDYRYLIKAKKRPERDEIYMHLAYIVARMSPCIRTKAGAVLVKGNRVIGIGFNGFRDPDDVRYCEHCPRKNLPSGEGLTLCNAIHAETSALYYKGKPNPDAKGATLYCTHLPTMYSTASIINAGIKEVVYSKWYPGKKPKGRFITKGRFPRRKKVNAGVEVLKYFKSAKDNIEVRHYDVHRKYYRKESWVEYDDTLEDDLFMQMAFTIAPLSNCWSRDVGALIVADKQVISMGVNGAAKGTPHCVRCKRHGLPSGEGLKVCPAAHGESNAIENSEGRDIDGSTIYVTTFPCGFCSRLIQKSGLVRVIFGEYYLPKEEKRKQPFVDVESIDPEIRLQRHFEKKGITFRHMPDTVAKYRGSIKKKAIVGIDLSYSHPFDVPSRWKVIEWMRTKKRQTQKTSTFKQAKLDI